MSRDKGVDSRTVFETAKRRFVSGDGPVTRGAEVQARKTGTLNPLVDPKGFGMIRRSLIRFDQKTNGLWQVAVGMPIPIECRVDTTGSMGGNIDIAMKVLPDLFEMSIEVLPGCDPQVALGNFNDVTDGIVLCRPQFEASATKIVEQLTLMVPERKGGDTPEDPHYGLFGAAFLTAPYVNRIGLGSYDFTISDAPARDLLDERQLVRIYGDEVFDKVVANGWQIDRHNLPTTKEVVQILIKHAHAFFLQVDSDARTTEFWINVFGANRVVVLPRTELLAIVQAVIIGLTEGTLSLQDVSSFLSKHGVSAGDARAIIRSVANIPIGAQAALPNFAKRPKKGDLFREKTDLWPISPEELAKMPKTSDKPSGDGVTGGTDWL